MARIELSDADFDAFDSQQAEQRVRAAGIAAPAVGPDQIGRALQIADKRGLPGVVVLDNLPDYEVQEHTDAVVQTAKADPVLGGWLADPVNNGLAKDDYGSLLGVSKAADPWWNRSPASGLNIPKSKLDVARTVVRQEQFAAEKARKWKEEVAKNPAGAMDYMRAYAGSVMRGVGYGVRGVGGAWEVAYNKLVGNPVSFLTGTDQTAGNIFGVAADAISGMGDEVSDGASAGFRKMRADNEITGEVFSPSSWDMGKDPSFAGFMANGTDVLGSLAPVIVASIFTGGSPIVGAGVGGSMGGGSAMEQAAASIDKMAADGTLEAQSAVYRDLVQSGVGPAEALAITKRRAEEWALTLTAPISMLGGAATTKILNPASAVLVGQRVGVQAAGRGALGAVEEAAQEVSEGVASQTGINVGAGTDLNVGEGSFGNAVLGAFGGAVPGTIAGTAAGLQDEDISANAMRRSLEKWTRASVAESDKASLDALMKQAAENKTRTRSAAKFEALVKAKVGDAKVYVPTESLEMLFQEDASAQVELLTGSSVIWDEALAAGTPVQIDMAAYVTRMAEFHDKIGADVRVSPDLDALEPAERLTPEQVQADIAAALAEGAIVDDEAARSGTVFNDFYGQLLGAGVEETTAAHQALAAQSVFRTWESRLGMEPDTLANRYQFNINRPQQAPMGGPRNVDAALDPAIEQVRKQRASGKDSSMAFPADNLASRIIAMGGINPGSVGAGDLRKVGRVGLLNNSGMTVEAAAEALANDGLGDLFTTKDEFGRPDYRELLEMLSDEAQGLRTFTDPSRSVSAEAAVENQARVDTVAGIISKLEGQGVAVDDLSVPELRALIEPMLNEDDVSGETGPSGMFYQDALPDTPTYEQLVAELARVNNLLRVDQLTGLRNRFAFEEDANLGWSTISVIDLDGLKNLNDSLGLKAGDALLKAAGGVMLAAETDGVRFYRQGGDEYAVRIRDADVAGPLLQEVIDRLESADVTITSKGVDYLYQGIGAGYGIGQTFEEANENEKADKQRRTEAGVRERRGADGTPRRLREVSPGESGGRRDGEGAQPEGVDQTETSAFKAWFGDSKVVDADGAPLVVYHGTSSDVDAFSIDKLGAGMGNTGYYGAGFYFTADPDSAAGYAGAANMRAADGVGPNVVPAYLSIQNPLLVHIGGKRVPESSNEASRESLGRLVQQLVDDRQFGRNPSADEAGSPYGAVMSYINRGDAYGAMSYLFAHVKGGEGLTFYAQRAGFDGVAVIGHSEDGSRQWFDEVVAFKPEQIKSATGNSGAFDPNNPSILAQGGTAPRGGILGGDGRSIIGDQPGADGRRVFNISLFAGMNYSTFLHENAHAFLEIFGDLAEAEGAPQQVKDDWSKALKFMGVENRGQIGRDQHELWARAGEAYLREGRAPSPSLRRSFANFKVWLTGIYRTATSLRVELTDEVRGVFDRMYATDAEIAEAKQQQGLGAMFRHGETIGMTPEEEVAYWNAVDAAQADAESALAAEVLTAQQRAAKAFLSAERRKVQAQVEEATRALRPYKSIRWLRQGLLPDGSPVPTPIKLSRQALLDAGYLPAFIQRHLSGMYSKNGGVSLETASDLLGYGSAGEMVQELVDAPPLQEVIRADTARIMAERYPDPLVDGTLVDRAMEAVHREKQGEAMLLGVQALERHVDGRVRSQAHVLMEVAKRLIATKRARDLQPNTYRLAEARNGRLALAAAAKQDWPAAASAARQQLLAHHLYNEARRARAEVDAAQKFLRKQGETNARQKLGKAGNYLTRDGSYLEQVDGILERYDLKPMSGAAADRRASLASWIQSQEEAGFDVAIPDSVRNEAQRTPFRELTVEQVREVRDAVKHIVAMARLRNKLLLAQDGRTLEDNVQDLVDTAHANHVVLEDSMDLSPSFSRKFGDWLSKIDATLLKPEFLFTWLDGEKANGQFWRKLFQPFVDAEADEVKRMAVVSTALRDLFKDYKRGKLSVERIHVPAAVTRKFAGNFTRESLLVVGLNMGNDYNRQAMMDGFDWTDAQLQAVAAHLTEADWDTVAGVWKLYESVRPDAFALEKAMTGLEPEQVEAAPFMTPNGRMLAGGYHPIKFDSAFSFRAFQRDAKQAVQDAYGGNFAKAATKKGHLKARTGTGGQPIKLSLSVVSEHLTNVIHDVTHRRALFDVQRLLDHPDVRGVIEATAGRNAYRVLNPWLQRIGADPAMDVNPLEAMFRRARVGATVVNMGFKITTAMTQLTGYTQSIEVIGAGAMAVGFREFGKNPRQALRFAMERSQVLPHRMQSYDRDVRDSLSRITSGGLRDDVQRSFFYLTGLMDMGVVVPTWLGAYHKAIGGDQPGVDAGNEADAIAYADGAVRQSQSSGSTKDLAMVQRGNEAFRMFTMFYSYFSVLYNLGRRAIKRTKSTKDLPRLAASTFYLWFVPYVLAELLAGRGPEDDEEWGDWFVSHVLPGLATYPVQTIPVVRDVINGAIGDFGYSPSPAFDAFESAVGSVKTVLVKGGRIAISKVTGNETEEEIKRRDIKEVVMAAGYWGKLPSRQAWITGSYLYDLAVGNEQPENIGDVFNGLAFSRPEPKE